MRVLLTCSNAAGNINPAIAIAEIILQYDARAEIAFVCLEGDDVQDMIFRKGFQIYQIKPICLVKPLWRIKNLAIVRKRKRWARSPEVLEILEQFRPDLVIGTGGCVCWPIIKAAIESGIPTVAHESDVEPDAFLKKLKNRISRIWINYPATNEELGLPNKTIRTGNPLREEFDHLTREEARAHLGIGNDKIVILSFVGNEDDSSLNEAALELMQNCVSFHPEILHWHICGKKEYESVRSMFEEHNLNQTHNCKVYDFISDMPYHLAAADLVISHAGAVTLSELAKLGKASIIIPTDSHQAKNAMALAEKNASVLFLEPALKDGILTEAVVDLLSSLERRQELETNIKEFADRETKSLIWQEIESILN